MRKFNKHLFINKKFSSFNVYTNQRQCLFKKAAVINYKICWLSADNSTLFILVWVQQTTNYIICFFKQFGVSEFRNFKIVF